MWSNTEGRIFGPIWRIKCNTRRSAMQRPSAEGVEEGDDAVKYDAMSSQAVLPIPPGTSEPMQPEQDKKLLPRSFGSAVLQTLPMLVLAAAGLLLSGRELDRVSVRARS